MRVAIVGAGLAGIIAESAISKAFTDSKVAVFDGKKTKGISDQHKAVMRLHNDSIKEYVNCSLRPIKVQKAVYHKGVIYDSPNLLLNNLYSLKVYDSIGSRSLLQLGSVERYLISNIRVSSVNYIRQNVLGIKDSQLLSLHGSSYDYDICISTIPMPLLLKLVGKDYEVKFKHRSVFVATFDLNIKSDVHQTLYFTDPSESIPYRVTIEGNKVIAEFLIRMEKEDIDLSLMNKIMMPFGINGVYCDEDTVETFEQKMGKIDPIDDNLRRRIMMELTDEFNVYSFGRFATWRPLRVDQVLEDIKKIIMLIRVKNKAYYFS